MRKVSLPLVWPAIIAGFIIVFLEAIALFGTPAIIGIPARINVVTTQLWQFFEYPVRVEVAAAYAMPLLLITAGMIVVQKLLLARKGFVSQTGKGGERRADQARPLALGGLRLVRRRRADGGGGAAVRAAAGVLRQGLGARPGLDNLTLANYRLLIFEHEMAMTSIWNTIWFSATAATIAVLLALLVAYIVNRRLVPFGEALGFLAMAPFVIPGIVMAIGFYAAYASPPFALYGTAAIIILAFTARFLPIAYANSSSAIRAVHPEMEEAARILGSGRLHAIGTITAPLVRKSLLGGWLIVFIVASREFRRRSSSSGRARGRCPCCCTTSARPAISRCSPPSAACCWSVTMVFVGDRHEAGRARLHAAEKLRMSRLSLQGLTKAYGPNRVVDRIDLTLEEGEFVSLLGPSGCGKTTTLRMIAGFVEPNEGSITLDGEIISSPGSVLPPERRRMSMIFQSYAVWPNMTVEENVAFGLKLRKLPGARDEAARRRDPGGGADGRTWPRATRPSFRAGSSSAWRWRARSW